MIRLLLEDVTLVYGEKITELLNTFVSRAGPPRP